jgi:hypothetical protein
MNLSKSQFAGVNLPPQRLNKGVSKSYKVLSEYLDMEIKQRKLERETCYPWQISCNWTPPGLNKAARTNKSGVSR